MCVSGILWRVVYFITDGGRKPVRESLCNDYVYLQNDVFYARLDEQCLTESGGCAAAPDFSLHAQRKVSKRKGTLLTRPAAAPCFASLTGARQLASLRHASLSFLSRTAMLDALGGNAGGLFNVSLDE
jgi:hypothetical protein